MMENGRTLNLEDFIVVCGKNIFKLCNIRNIRITRSQSYGLIFLVPGRGNETGKMGPMGRHGGNVSNVSNATESPWPEAIMAIMAIMGHRLTSDAFPAANLLQREDCLETTSR